MMEDTSTAAEQELVQKSLFPTDFKRQNLAREKFYTTSAGLSAVGSL